MHGLQKSKRLQLSSCLCRLTKELPVKGCTECRFSNGGHMFAAVSGNNIFIYATYNCDLIGTLR